MYNPYQSPNEFSFDPSVYYKWVPTKASLRELKRLSPNLLIFGLFTIVKAFRVQLPNNLAIAVGQQERLEFSQVPTRIHERFGDELNELDQLGYEPVFALGVPVIGAGESYALIFLGPQSDRIAGCLFSRSSANETDFIETGVAITSTEQSSDRQITTTSMRLRYNPPARCDTEHHVDDTVSQLDQRHTQRINGVDIVAVDPEIAWRMLSDNARYVAQCHCQRGLLTPINDEEYAALTQ